MYIYNILYINKNKTLENVKRFRVAKKVWKHRKPK